MLTNEQIKEIQKLGITRHFETATKHKYVCGMTTAQKKCLNAFFGEYGLNLSKCNTCNYKTVVKMAHIYNDSVEALTKSDTNPTDEGDIPTNEETNTTDEGSNQTEEEKKPTNEGDVPTDEQTNPTEDKPKRQYNRKGKVSNGKDKERKGRLRL